MYDPKAHGCDCEQCVLGPHGPVYDHESWRPVPPELRRKAILAFVGEAPGGGEYREGRPFIGVSGQYLEATLSKLNPPLRRSNVSITNAALCYPGTKLNMRAAIDLAKRLGKRSPAEACNAGGRVLKELKGILVVVPAGGTALKLLSGREHISNYRGSPIVFDPKLFNKIATSKGASKHAQR